jgi:hypothetical protein
MQCKCAILSSVACPALQHFSTYLIKGTICARKLPNIKCAVRDSPQILSDKFFILRRIERNMIKNVYRSYVKCLSFLPDLMKLEFSRQMFEKHSKNKFHENLSCGSRVVLCGQTDGRMVRHDEANSRFS